MKKPICRPTIVVFAALALLGLPRSAHAMHIMEGFLPPGWSLFWTLASLPFFISGFLKIKKLVHEQPQLKMLLAFAGAFVFVLSALKLPSVTGSCSHPTGIGLGAILFGALPMSVLGCLALLFQALLLGHGGITTLGANTFSMAVCGPFIACLLYRLMKRLTCRTWLCVFLSAAAADLLTYCITSAQLALAFPAEAGGFAASFFKFLSIFAVTQVPLAVSEGLLTVVVFNALAAYSFAELRHLTGAAAEELRA